MSLLGDLAKNSCVIDFSMEEFLPTLSIQQIASEASEISQTKSNHSSYSLISCTVVSPERKRLKEISSGLEDMSWGLQSRYFQKYRDKFSKINAIVSLLSAKTRKMKFQFMVHLQRWCKDQINKELKEQKQTKNKQSSEMKNYKSQQNALIFYSGLQQMVSMLEGKQKVMKRWAFDRVHKKLRCWMKVDFLGKVIQECQKRWEKEQKRSSFVKLVLHAKNCQKIRKNINVSKPINIPKIIKNPNIKVNTDQKPLPFPSSQQPLQPLKLLPTYPQQKWQQSIDFCTYYSNIGDTMNLFMTNEEKGSQYSISKGSASFGVNSCVSAFDSKISSSPKSYHKMLSQIQFTAVPQSALQRRKVSDFISSVDQRNVSEYTQEGRKHCDSMMNPTKSEAGLENKNFFIKDKVFDQDNFDQKGQTYDFFIKKQEIHERRLSSPEQIVRSRSEVKIHQTEKQKWHKDEIEQNYKQEMNRYLKFKKSLQQRRNSTLKEIQKSQQTIRKLMVKYKKQKHKSNKLKNNVKIENSKEGSIRATSKNVRDSSSRKLSLTQKHKKQDKRKNSIKHDEKLVNNSFLSKNKREYSPILDQQQGNMDIYSHYINQKKKMGSEKSTPIKKNSKGTFTEQSSAKKHDKKMIPSSGHKNLLALSDYPIPKEHRIDVKINLLNQNSKKKVHFNNKKQKVKNDIKQNEKQKIKQKPK